MKKTAMTNPAPAEEKMLSWPDAYYLERDPKRRREMLDLALAGNSPAEEDRIRQELFTLRYPGFGKKQADAFLNAWITFRSIGNSANSLFSLKRTCKREISRELERMGFGKMQAYGKKGEDLLYLEIRHMGMLYFTLCQEDKQYRSIILGVGHMGDDSVAAKAAGEAYEVGYFVPARYGFREACRLWSKGIGDAYRMVFPESGFLDAYLKESE